MSVREPGILDLVLMLLLIAVVGSICTAVITAYNFVVNVFEAYTGHSLEKIVPDTFPIYATIVSVAGSLTVFSIFMKIGRALRRV